MKAFIILNPASGKQASEPINEAINRYFTNSHIDYEIYETKKDDKPGDIVRKRLTEGFDLVIAAGGDGTVSAVIDGLIGSHAALAIIPAGTENLLARDLTLPLEIEKAVEIIAGPHKFRKIDAMRIGERAYILNVSLGISASVISGTTPKSKSRFGRIAYVWTGISKIFTFRNRYLVVTIDGKVHTVRAIEASISNCGLLSKVLYPKGPDVRIDDGHLDVYIMSLKTLLDYPRYLFEMITRRPSKRLSHFINSEKSVSIRSRVPLPVQADGDIIGTTPIEVELLAGELTVLVPEKSMDISDKNLDRERVRLQYLPGFAQTGRIKARQ
jgi:diacylglycerol kinase (ATP)